MCAGHSLSVGQSPSVYLAGGSVMDARTVQTSLTNMTNVVSFHVCVCVGARVHVCMHMRVHMHACAHVCAHAECVCMHVCAFVCI